MTQEERLDVIEEESINYCAIGYDDQTWLLSLVKMQREALDMLSDRFDETSIVGGVIKKVLEWEG